MTIGVGFLCVDGAVLFADRQVTVQGGFKDQEHKISSSTGQDYSFAVSYAGYPDSAQVMFYKIKESIPAIISGKKTFASDNAIEVLAKTFKDPEAKNLHTLIAMTIKHSQPFLLKTVGRTIVQGYAAEYIGCGDSSALRYLADYLIPETRLFTVQEAQVIGNYFVSVANRFIDGCSGGPDYVTVLRDGSISHAKCVFPNQEERFNYCEKQAGSAMRELLWSGGTKIAITQPTDTLK